MGFSSVLPLVPRYLSDWRYFRIAITLLGFATIFSSCSEKTITFNGKALGTTWTVKIRASRYLDRSVLKDEIISTIEEAEKILSHWRPDAELYQFNQALTSNPITVHPLLHELLLHARKVHDESAGAFDPTIAPIVNLWGFGPVESTRTSFPPLKKFKKLNLMLVSNCLRFYLKIKSVNVNQLCRLIFPVRPRAKLLIRFVRCCIEGD